MFASSTVATAITNLRSRVAARINEVDTAIAELQELRASLVAADTNRTTPAAVPIRSIVETGTTLSSLR